MDATKGKKLYGPSEGFRNLYKAIISLPDFKAGKRSGALDLKFQERIMLAVTEVNGCPLCTYVHTRIALEAGLADGEVVQLLEGALSHAPDQEKEALLFAQHYADSRGKYSKKAFDRIVETYGRKNARAILGAIRLIMVGNTYGIPMGSFSSRFGGDKSKKDSRSTFGYELAMLLTFVPFGIIAFFSAHVARLFGSNPE
jgi:AhpD family alkylhydroperoxidase